MPPVLHLLSRNKKRSTNNLEAKFTDHDKIIDSNNGQQP